MGLNRSRLATSSTSFRNGSDGLGLSPTVRSSNSRKTKLSLASLKGIEEGLGMYAVIMTSLRFQLIQ